MATRTDMTDRKVSSVAARYRAAEAELWARYKLDVVEHHIVLNEPSVRVRVVEAGSGAPILLVPGTGGTGPYWAPLVRELTGFRCLMLDRPGWGLSRPITWQASTYGITAATIQRGVLDQMNVSQADVVGASVGNLWALRLAQHEATRVRRVMLLGGGPVAAFPVPRFIRLLASPFGAVLVRLPTPRRAHRSQLEAIGHGKTLAEGRMDGFVAWRTAFARDTPSLRHERAMVQALIHGSGWKPGFIPTDAELAAVRHRVRMLFGSEDPTGTAEGWRRFVDRLPHAELEVLAGAGHMPWWDAPQAVGRSVRAFLGSDPG